MSFINSFLSDLHSHLAASSSTVFSIVIGGSILQSVIVGVLVYVITHSLSALWQHIKK